MPPGGSFPFAIKGRLICRKAGACLPAIQLVAIAGKQAPTNRVNLIAQANWNQVRAAGVLKLRQTSSGRPAIAMTASWLATKATSHHIAESMKP